jgi:hypothetical protein
LAPPLLSLQLASRNRQGEATQRLDVFSTQVEGEKMDVVDTSEKNDEPPSGLGPEY